MTGPKEGCFLLNYSLLFIVTLPCPKITFMTLLLEAVPHLYLAKVRGVFHTA